jgi:hypothetical protein
MAMSTTKNSDFFQTRCLISQCHIDTYQLPQRYPDFGLHGSSWWITPEIRKCVPWLYKLFHDCTNSEVGPTGNVVWFGDLKSWSCSEQQMGGVYPRNIPYNWEAFIFTFGSFLGFFWAGIHSSIFYGLGLGSMNVFRPIIEILRHIVSLTLVQEKIYIPVGCFHAWKFRTLEPSAVES